MVARLACARTSAASKSRYFCTRLSSEKTFRIASVVKMSRNTAESRIVEVIRYSPVGCTLAVRPARSSGCGGRVPRVCAVGALRGRCYADSNDFKQIEREGQACPCPLRVADLLEAAQLLVWSARFHAVCARRNHERRFVSDWSGWSPPARSLSPKQRTFSKRSISTSN